MPPRAKLPPVVACLVLLGAPWLAACHPKLQLEAPEEPITINLNLKIEHEVRVKVDRDLDQLFAKDDENF